MRHEIRVAVVDDHQLFREGLAELLATAGDVRVVGQAGTAADALLLVTRTQPDVVLLDLDMPDTLADRITHPGATTRRIRAASPGTSVVVLTMHDEAELVRTLLDAGAQGYLVKSSSRDELLSAVRSAASGSGSVTISLSRDTVLQLAQPVSERDLLTPRERSVLDCLAAGASNRAIAAELHMSEATVKRHLATMYLKLGVSSRLAAVVRARELRLIDSAAPGPRS